MIGGTNAMPRQSWSKVGAAAGWLCLAAAANASETITYSYDGNGRLVKVEHSGSVNNGTKTEYGLDKADNRASVTVTGAAIYGTIGDDNPLNGSPGDDTIHALAGADRIYVHQGGSDTVYGGAGADISYFGTTFNSADRIHGDADYDGLFLRGNYVIDFNSGAYSSTLTNVENVTFLSTSNTVYESGGSAFTYNVVASDSMLASGATMTFNGGGLQTGETVTFDGSGETGGHLRVFAGGGNDLLVTGAGNDLIYGGPGTDRMSGGAGADVFRLDAAGHSSGPARDTIVGFNDQTDRIDLTVAVTSFGSAIASGTLSTVTFDSDMSAAMTSLAAAQARKFTPSSGSLANRIFLIVDLNGTAGYQPGADLVLEMESPAALSGQSVSIFI
jgi:YD repeat-containing protein